MLLWTGGKWIEGLPDSLKSLSEPAFIGVSPLGWLVLALLLAGGWLLSRTAFGRDFYAVGDNLAAARQLGVAVNRTRMLAFTFIFCAKAEVVADAINMRQAAFVIIELDFMICSFLNC